jgi:hypothetical protein
LAFTAKVIGADVTPENDHGIWSYANGTLGLALREGAAAPGLSGAVFGGLSETFSSLVINNQGRMAFRANAIQAGGSIPTPAGMGIWSNAAGSLALVAKVGDQAAGAPAGVSFLSLGNPLMSNSGQVVFTSSVAGSGVDSTNDIGVWIQRGSQLELVAREGAHAPGLPDGVVFTGFSNVSMNDAGQVAFQATLRTASVPISHQGIWATDPNGVLRLVVLSGDTYELSPGNPLRLGAGLTFLGGSSGSDGRPSAFNARGEIAFAAVFFGGVEALFVAAAVPEPASPLLIALAVVTLGPARRRRFRRASPC